MMKKKTFPSASFFQQAVISCRSRPGFSTDEEKGKAEQAIKNIIIRHSFFSVLCHIVNALNPGVSVVRI